LNSFGNFKFLVGKMVHILKYFCANSSGPSEHKK
jgi:hypothetical protein